MLTKKLICQCGNTEQVDGYGYEKTGRFICKQCQEYISQPLKLTEFQLKEKEKYERQLEYARMKKREACMKMIEKKRKLKAAINNLKAANKKED